MAELASMSFALYTYIGVIKCCISLPHVLSLISYILSVSVQMLSLSAASAEHVYTMSHQKVGHFYVCDNFGNKWTNLNFFHC